VIFPSWSTVTMLSNDTNENKVGEAFNFDDILEHIGQMGKFQLRTCLLLCIPAFFPGMVVMSYNFTGHLPQYRYNISIYL